MVILWTYLPTGTRLVSCRLPGGGLFLGTTVTPFA